ncbi:hypothetical protein MKX01_001312, partial [Papaver californicum]
MPLPSSCPIEFACVPEQLVEDAIEVLLAVFTYSESLPMSFLKWYSRLLHLG